MRREAVATDPLAQLPNQQQAYHPPPSTPPPLDRGDRVAVTPPRPLPVPLLSPDESAEIMMNNFSSKCR